MEALTATVKQLTEILAQVGASLAAATQKLEQTTKSLLSCEESLTSTKELLASSKEELATTKEELASANQSLASTKEKLEQTASALTQSHMYTVNMLDVQIGLRNEDIEMARTTVAESEWDQKDLDEQIRGVADVPDKLRKRLSVVSNEVCTNMANTMATLSWRIALWEERNKETIASIKDLESQLES